MELTRRSFIGGAAAFGALPVMRLSAAYAPSRKPTMSFGVVSDVHVRIAPDGKGLLKSHDCSAFVHALEWFRDQKVDAVMLAGDIADTGLVAELEAVAAAWWKVFPGSKAPDGRHVERVFITGNHDWDAYTYDGGVFVSKLYPDEAERNRNLLCRDLKGCWERIMQEPYVPVYRKDVKGYSFVGAHWQDVPCHPKCETAFRHVGKWFAENGAKLDPSKPFFYCQHAHLQNTVYGSWAWGHDSGETTAALMALPNAVAFSGLRACATPGDELHPDSGYENSWGGQNAFKAMRTIPETSQQGMLVRVFGDCIAFTRRDFSIDKMLGGDWVMPLPAAKSKVFSFEARRAKEKPPAFAAGAALSVARVEATNRGGKAKVNGVKKIVPQEKKPAVRIQFPQADAVRATRPFFYEATFSSQGGASVVKRMVATNLFKPDDEYWTGKGETMTVCLDQLPTAPLKIELAAVSALGNRSRPLVAAL